jgi:hypothetical protein
MRLRETKPILESDFSITASNRQRIHSKGGDVHRAASGGASVLLSPRFKTHGKDSDVRVSQYNGDEVHIRTDDPLSRQVARGGLLCDDPGLGKTITVVSLILQTLGLSTEASSSIEDDTSELAIDTASDDRIFAEYWREQLVPEFRCQALNKLVSAFLRSSRDVDYFVYPVDPERDVCPDYLDIIQHPICFSDIRRKINNHTYGDSFASFQADVVLCFR